MQALFGRYWLRILIGAIILIALAILVQIFKETNFVAAWVFNFVNDWAATLSAATAVLLIMTAFMAIRENRRTRALDTIRSWAEDAIMLLYVPSEQEIPLLKWSELEIKLKTIHAKSVGVLANANKFGGDLDKKVNKAVAKLSRLIDTVNRANRLADALPSVEELLKDLLEVMDSASKL